MDFLYFVIKRALVAIPLLIGISIASFAIIQAVPGDFVDTWIANTSAQTGKSYDQLLPQAKAMRERLGLDQPMIVQYLTWLKNIVFVTLRLLVTKRLLVGDQHRRLTATKVENHGQPDTEQQGHHESDKDNGRNQEGVERVIARNLRFGL